MLSAAQITCTDYDVWQTWRDRCTARAQQVVDEPRDPPLSHV